MGKIKAIKCPKMLKGCGAVCVEVGHSIGYPKGLYDDPKRTYHEYRFVCPKCGKEWIKDTLDRGIYRIPDSSQFRIKLVNGKEVIKANPKNPGYELIKNDWKKYAERR